MVLLAAEGLPNAEIGRQVGVTRQTVIAWRTRYEAGGIDALADLPRSGRPPVIDEAAVVVATLNPPPAALGVTHWSARLMADHLRRAGMPVSFAEVARIWRDWDLQPHRVETFKFSTDPQLEAKVRDVVGLYLDPPANAVVVCVDEKSQIQALDRTAPLLPMRFDQAERRTHDYVRHGTTTLFAALEVATGKITADACYPRHRNGEFLAFLKQVAKAHPRVKLHVVCDNYATHSHPNVKAWLAKQPADHHALHPDQRVLDEHGRDLLRDHHPPGHPPRHLHQRARPDRRDPHLHRRLQPTLRTVPLDQDRRPDPHQSQPSKDLRHATLLVP